MIPVSRCLRVVALVVGLGAGAATDLHSGAEDPAAPADSVTREVLVPVTLTITGGTPPPPPEPSPPRTVTIPVTLTITGGTPPPPPEPFPPKTVTVPVTLTISGRR